MADNIYHPEHKANNLPSASDDHQGTERAWNYSEGVRSMKKQMADVLDASGQAYPDSPHYTESQDATSMADFRK